jgi:hypothetical protein
MEENMFNNVMACAAVTAAIIGDTFKTETTAGSRREKRISTGQNILFAAQIIAVIAVAVLFVASVIYSFATGQVGSPF